MKFSEFLEHSVAAFGRADELDWRRERASGATSGDWMVITRDGKPIRKGLTKDAAVAIADNRADLKKLHGPLFVKRAA